MNNLYAQLVKMDANAEDLSLLNRTMDHLDEVFLLCVVGEFNSGKSSLINALLGDRSNPIFSFLGTFFI